MLLEICDFLSEFGFVHLPLVRIVEHLDGNVVNHGEVVEGLH
jgi:hypothetical protein